MSGGQACIRGYLCPLVDPGELVGTVAPYPVAVPWYHELGFGNDGTEARSFASSCAAEIASSSRINHGPMTRDNSHLTAARVDYRTTEPYAARQ